MSEHGTSVSPDARRIWRTARVPVWIGLLFLAVGLVLALMSSSGGSNALDPESARPDGSRALARLLDDRGVVIEATDRVNDASNAASGATLLITRPDVVPAPVLRDLLAQASDVVLIAPERDVDRVLPGIEVDDYAVEDVYPPECSLPAASAAGTASMGGVGYQVSDAAGARAECYPTDSGATLVRVERAGLTVTLLGTGTPLTNEALDEEGNAALAMRLLGGTERVVWYMPSPVDPGLRAGDESLADLLPDGWRFGLIQLAIAVVLLALWRARRLGQVVAEPLPVVVRAAETTQGRALLYRKAGASEHAAEALRAAARSRISNRLGLATDAGPEAVVAAAAARVARAPAEIHQLLYGPAPADDAALVRIADDLDTLESEVGRA